jgi:hypothetical protein
MIEGGFAKVRIPGDVARESGMMSSTQSDLMSLGVPR